MIKVYGAGWCPDCQRTKAFLGKHKIAYEWIDIELSNSAATEVEKRNDGKRIIPTVVFDDASHLAEPTDQELAEKLKIQTDKTHNFHDLIVIGGGPSGLTASIYTSREGIHTAIIEGKAFGGQAGLTDQIDNYPGFPEGVTGFKLATDMRTQAEKFGVETISDNATGIKEEDGYKKISTESGQEFLATAVLISSGADYKRLNVPGEEGLIGHGIHFCATCDGPFYKDKELIIIGGGNSAMQEGIFLTRFAKKISLIVRAETLKGSKILQDNVGNDPKFEIHYNLETKSFSKENGKITITALNTRSGREEKFAAAGVFVFIGLKPNTDWLKKSKVELDDYGFIKTDKGFQTSLKGVFAAGDCRRGSTAQIASAVGEGATAAIMIREFLKNPC